MRSPALTLLLLAFLAFFAGLGRTAITDADEAFYAEASREMVESGNWLTPRYNYEDRWQKPVLYYWLTAATYLITGPTEWAARLWSALAGLGLVFLTWAAAREMTGRDDVGWLAGAIVATCFGCYFMARMALPDLPLTFFITLAIWAAFRAAGASSPGWSTNDDASGVGVAAGAPRFAGTGGGAAPEGTGARLSGATQAPGASAAGARRSRTAVTHHRRAMGATGWWAVTGLAAGLGFLMKGPVALVIPAVALLPIWWRERSTVTLRPGGILLAAAVFVLVGLPWYVAMWAEHGTPYLHSFFLADNLERFATDRFNQPRGFGFYVPVVLGGLMPWSAFVLALAGRPLLAILRGRRRLLQTEWRLLCWALMPLLFYTLSIGKQPRYVLPILVPLAILLARSIIRAIGAASSPAAPSLPLRTATWVTAAIFGVGAVLLARAQPLFISAYPWATWMGVGALAASAVALALVALTRDWWRLVSVLPIAAVLLMLAAQFGGMGGIRPEPVEQMAQLVLANRTAGEPTGSYRAFVRNLVFYAGIRHEGLFDEPSAIEFLQSSERVLLVLRARDLERLQSIAEFPARTLGSVRYLDTGRFRLRTLLSPDPARDIDTVLLVTNR